MTPKSYWVWGEIGGSVGKQQTKIFVRLAWSKSSLAVTQRKVPLKYSFEDFLEALAWNYHKNPKIMDTLKFAVITLKVEQDGFSLDAEGITNSVDPDQTAPLGPGSALFPQTCLSENLGKLNQRTIGPVSLTWLLRIC